MSGVIYEIVDEDTITYEVTGEKGDAGAAGSGYNHTQSSPNTTWTISHNLGIRPSVETFSVGGVLMWGDIVHLDLNTTQVTFATALSGYARCS